MESTQQGQQPTDGSRARPRLERPRDDRAIAGVASGLARYLNIDVAWVRIAFVVTALFGGTGILAYLIGWLAMPEEGRSESIAADKIRRAEGAGSWIGVGLIVLAGLIVLGNADFIGGELLFAAILVGLGVLLYRGDIGQGSHDDGPGHENWGDHTEHTERGAAIVPAAATATPPASPASPGGGAASPTPYESRPPAAAFRPRPVRRREPSLLGRIALAATLITVGLMGIGQSAGWFQPELRHYAAVVFVIFGGALLVSTIYGRARWLIVIGLVLSPLLVAMALIRVPLQGGFGDPTYVPSAVVDFPTDYRLIAGEMTLDLTELDLATEDTLSIEASVAFGRLEVIVPADLQVDVVAKVDVGEMYLDGTKGSRTQSGGTDNVHLTRSISYGGGGHIDLLAHVGFGEVDVHQVAEVTP